MPIQPASGSSGHEIWLRFLTHPSANQADRPTLWIQRGDTATEIPVSDDLRILLSLLGAGNDVGTNEDVVPGLPMWTTAGLLDRLGVNPGNRTAVTRRFDELRQALRDAGVDDPDRYVRHLKRGEWGLADVRVDVRELIAAKNAERVDDVLRPVHHPPQSLGLAPEHVRLFGNDLRATLSPILADAQERWENRHDSESTRRPPRANHSAMARLALALAAVAAVAVVAVVLLTGSSRQRPATGRGVIEYSGGATHSWSDYAQASGKAGPEIRYGEGVRVVCRVRGFVVSDGDVWWYRLGSKPWDGRLYASADAFYNRNGQRSGSLSGTPEFDPRVTHC